MANVLSGTGPSATRSQTVTTRTPVSLVIPVFNSAISLRNLHRAIIERATSSDYDFEIVYVDDGSTDGSPRILQDIRNEATNVVVVEHPSNRGQSTAVLTGILTARSEIIVTLDDDLQHNPEDIARLLAVLKNVSPTTLVMGIADALKRPLWRAAAALFANAISNLFLAKPLPLKLTTFCAFHRQLCASLHPDSERDVPLVTALVQAAGATRTVPVYLGSSQRGRSRYGVAALFRLFMSRSNYYSIFRVRAWLAAWSLPVIASGALLLMQDVDPYPVLTALLLVLTAIPWLILAMLAVKIGRDTRKPNPSGISRSV